MPNILCQMFKDDQEELEACVKGESNCLPILDSSFVGLRCEYNCVCKHCLNFDSIPLPCSQTKMGGLRLTIGRRHARTTQEGFQTN